MRKKVFISGSISIHQLPDEAIGRIDDGSTQPMMFELDYVPTVDQMQELFV